MCLETILQQVAAFAMTCDVADYCTIFKMLLKWLIWSVSLGSTKYSWWRGSLSVKWVDGLCPTGVKRCRWTSSASARRKSRLHLSQDVADYCTIFKMLLKWLMCTSNHWCGGRQSQGWDSSKVVISDQGCLHRMPHCLVTPFQLWMENVECVWKPCFSKGQHLLWPVVTAVNKEVIQPWGK